MKTQLIGSMLALGLAMPGMAAAQAYPAKPVHLVVGFAAGGGADFVARAVGQKLGERLGQTIVVDNKPGANGVVASEFVARAAPDGYTFLLGAAGSLVVAPHLGAISTDTFKDLTPVSLIAISPFVVTLHPSVKANSIQELIALAKASPGKINYGTSGTGGSPQLATELFKSMTGVNIVHVPYKGLAPAITDLLGGQIQVVFADIGLVKGHIAAGKLKGLGVTSANRSAAVPDLPSIAEAGVPGYAAGTWYGILAPAATPADVVSRVSAETRAVLAADDMKAAFIARGMDTADTSPEQFGGFMREEFAKWGKVIKEAGIKAQ